MQSQKHKWLPGATLAVAGFNVPLGVAAQTPPLIEEVVVTAQKREQSALDVPMALQAFGGEKLEQRGFRDINDIVSDIPGASEGISTGPGQKVFQIRGISSLAGDSTVGYYLDEAAFAIPGYNIAPLGRLFDVARVEVLRGPQGTLYGQGSMGGTMRFITNDPDLDHFGAKFSTGASSTEGGEPSYYGDVALSLPIIPDALALKLVGSREDRGGYADIRELISDDDVDDYSASNYRAKLLWEPTEAISARFGYQKSELEQDYMSAYTPGEPPRLISSGRDAFTNTAIDQYYGNVSVDLGALTLENNLGYIEYGFDQDVEFPFKLGPGGTAIPIPQILIEDADVLSNELRLVTNSGGPFNGVAGVFYQDSTRETTVAVPGLAPANLSTIDSQSWSVFGEASWAFMDGLLTPLIGLRYFQDDRDFYDDASTAGINIDDTRESDTFESVNPRFNLSITPESGDLYYLNIAKGFRSGIFNRSSSVLFGEMAGFDADYSVEPDELWSYEIGTKSLLLDGRLVFEGALYYNNWSDIQLNVNPGLMITLNAGDAEIYGIDYAFSWQPVERLNLRLSGNYNEAEFSAMPEPVANAIPGDFLEKGHRLPFVPEWNATLSGDYTWNLGLAGLNGYLYLALNHTDAQFSNDAVGGDQDLLKARIGVQSAQWSLYLFGENLLDEDDPILNQASTLLDAQTRAYPRQVGVSFSYEL